MENVTKMTTKVQLEHARLARVRDGAKDRQPPGYLKERVAINERRRKKGLEPIVW